MKKKNLAMPAHHGGKSGRQGFTIVELLIAFSIGIMMIVGGVVAGNKFNANQKVDTATSKVEEAIRLARNYATTRQKPAGFIFQNIDYVVFSMNSNGNYSVRGGINIGGIDAAHPFLTSNVNSNDVSVNSGTATFSVPEGKLLVVQGASYVPAGIGNSIAVIITSREDTFSAQKVLIDASGKVSVEKTVGVEPPTSTPVPPSPTPVCVPVGNNCSVASICCNGSCISGTCQMATCFSDGQNCLTDGDCCFGLTCDGSLHCAIGEECLFPNSNPHSVEQPDGSCLVVNTCGSTSQACQ